MRDCVWVGADGVGVLGVFGTSSGFVIEVFGWK